MNVLKLVLIVVPLFLIGNLVSAQSTQTELPPGSDAGEGDYCLPELYDSYEVGCYDCYIQEDGTTNCAIDGPCSDCFDISPWTEDYLKLEIFYKDHTEVKKIVDYTISNTLPDGSSGVFLEWVPYEGG